MSTEAIGAAAPGATAVTMDVDQQQPPGLHSPPDSNNAMNLDGSDSELSDLDELADKLNDGLPDALPDHPDHPEPQKVEQPPVVEEKKEEEVEDIGEVLPDHWSGTVPVFKPTMKQFKDFKLFMTKVDSYGMKSGIIKIIPPQEWKDSLPELDDLVKPIRVREPIKQDIMGSNGTYRQVNILHQRSYNLPQWRQLCDQSEHQPPARRGERRANAEKHKPVRRAPAAPREPRQALKKKRGRVTRGKAAKAKVELEDEDEDERPMTPVSPSPEQEKVVESIEQDPGIKEEDGECDDEDDMPVVRRMGFTRQSKPKTQSTSARRKYIRREGSAMIDEAAFKDWDYRMDVSDYTPERCEELERIYWKTLTYAPPLYGADLPGTLFHESTELWNLNKLPNLLDVLGTKVPGVNTAYLYLGMWKATFAWHLEDVDLYSINYLHFGAPKQWYSISQADARRFETAMKNIWPTEAKACDQFLRHKAFLISPAHLKQHYNITVNKCVSYPGEFVVTYPYGYHSGYNLGYNCAEAVNFALDSWLPLAKIAKKCQCAQAQDSVWVDVYEIERKLRGESTEYEETEDESEEDEEDDQETGLPSPPSSHTVRIKGAGRKRKRTSGKEPKIKTKKIRVRLKPHVEPPCCLCPNDIPGAEILSTEDGRKAHRMCCDYLPETYIETVDGVEIVANVGGIEKSRLELKCLYCRSKKGACFQCSQKKCPRPYHATCAAAAGVFVEEGEIPIIGEDGTEYKEPAWEFSCRFHRTKRDRKLDGDALEEKSEIRKAAKSLKKGDICQMQYFRGEIFAGVVVENRPDEETLLLDIIPNGDRVEVEWKWLLLPDPADFRLPKASPNAIPMPTCRKAKREINAKRQIDEVPRKDDEFGKGFVWAEFHTNDSVNNAEQTKVDFSREDQIWHYLGKTSTEAKAQYTESPSKQLHNTKSNFLDSIPKPVSKVPIPPPAQPRRSYAATHAPQASSSGVFSVVASGVPKQPKPYVYKPRKPIEPQFATPYTSQTFMPKTQTPVPPPILPYPPSRSQPQQSPQQLSFSSPVHPPQHPPQPRHAQPLQHVQHPQQGLAPKRPPPQQQATFQVKQYRPPVKGGRGKDSSMQYSPDRFAPVGGSNGFPQLPGLTWPPAHMKSGHYSQPHSRVWSPSTDAAPPRPYLAPMTSSSLKPSTLGHPQVPGAAGSQPQACAYQKYSYFQVHHNRDASRYRTPYAPWGGFTNGYEGNIRAFLAKAQQALSGKKDPVKNTSVSLAPIHPSRASILPLPVSSASAGYTSPYGQKPQPNVAASPLPFTRQLGPSDPIPESSLSAQHLASSTPLWDVRQPGSAPLHPAIRPQFGGSGSGSGPGSWQHNRENHATQQGWGTNSRSTNPTPQRHAPAVKAPSFHKQSTSPIPLPPYVKQMAASTSTPKSSPLSRPPQQPGPSTPDPVSKPSSPSVQQPALQPAPPPATSASPAQTFMTAQPTTPFTHSFSPQVNSLHVQMPMHPPQRDQWAPSPGYSSSQGSQQPSPTSMMPPPPSPFGAYQQHQHQQHQQQHYSPHQGMYNHQGPPPGSPYQYLQHQPNPQQQTMHHMPGNSFSCPIDSHYPAPPPAPDFGYPPPPPNPLTKMGSDPMLPTYPESEDPQALLEKMMFNLKRASGQLNN